MKRRLLTVNPESAGAQAYTKLFFFDVPLYILNRMVNTVSCVANH